jgi:hypothetical protein
MGQIVALGHQLRQIAARDDEAAFLCRRKPHRVVELFQAVPRFRDLKP